MFNLILKLWLRPQKYPKKEKKKYLDIWVFLDFNLSFFFSWNVSFLSPIQSPVISVCWTSRVMQALARYRAVHCNKIRKDRWPSDQVPDCLWALDLSWSVQRVEYGYHFSLHANQKKYRAKRKLFLQPPMDKDFYPQTAEILQDSFTAQKHW